MWLKAEKATRNVRKARMFQSGGLLSGGPEEAFILERTRNRLRLQKVRKTFCEGSGVRVAIILQIGDGLHV